MTQDYSLDLNIMEAPADISFGDFEKTAKPFVETDQMGFGEALLKGTLMYRLGRKVNQEVSLGEDPDTDYDGFERWKNSGLPDNFLSKYMAVDSEAEADAMEARIAEDTERNQRISEAGFKGHVADFLTSVALDPTTYFGFGAGMMLKAGTKTATAFGISGGLAGGTYAALDAVASPEQASAAKSAAIIGGAAIMGGVLGQGVETFAKLKSKGIVNKNFHQMTEDTFNSLANTEMQSVGAMVNPEAQLFDGGVAGNAVAKTLARSTRLISPKLWGQTAELKETRNLFSRLFGVNLKTESTEAGAAAPISVIEEVDTLRDQSVRQIQKAFGDTGLIKMFGGKQYTRDDAAQALRRLWNGETSDGLTDIQKHIYEFNKKYYSDYSKVMVDEKVPHYNERKDYGAPMIISSERILENMDLAKKSIADEMFENRALAAQKIDEMNAQIKEISTRIDEFSNDKPFVNFYSKKIETLEDQIERLSRLRNATDDEILEDAAITANDMANGMFEFKEMLDINKLPTKSKFFNPREVDPVKFIDFLEVDPAELARRYADSVTPHIAFNRAFPQYKNIQELTQDYMEKAKIEASRMTDGQKAVKEIEAATQRMERMWRDETGITHAEKVQELGEFAPYVAATNKGMYITQMGGQTLAAIQEPLAIAMHHGIGGAMGLLGVIKSMATNKEFREMAVESLKYAGIGMEDAKNILLQNRMAFEISQKELGNKLAKGSEKGALWMARANASIFWDKFMRLSMASAQEGILSDHILKFDKIKPKLKKDLAFLGVDQKNVRKIQQQINKHSTQVDGRFVSNIQKWDDQLAQRAWINMLRKDNKRTSLQPQTGDTPFMFRTPLGQLFWKYRSWGVTAHQKYALYAAQNPEVLGGVIGLIAASTLTQTLLEASQGKEVNTDPDELLWAGINRSGVLGVLPEAGGSFLMNRLLDIQSGGGRIYEYQDATGIIAGPTGEFFKDLTKVTGAAIPKYDEEAGEYGMTFYDRNGEVKQGVVNSFIDMMPIPLAKPWLKESLKDDED